jgi:Protein of unknown function (DUF3105)
VSSRQEEKQKRREERLAREQAEKAAAARRQRLTLAGAVLAGVAVIAVVVLLVSGTLGGGDDGGEGAAQDVPSTDELADENITLPSQQIGDLTAAAKAAGCKVTNPPIEGRGHETKDFTEADYKTNPPTSGSHFPQWYEDGIYGAGDTPNLGMLVHTLEHGRIDVQYKPGTPAHTVKQLEALLSEQEDGYHMLLFQNGTNMDAQIAATAWGHSLTCPQFNNKVFDALRTFRAKYIDKGPEDVP